MKYAFFDSAPNFQNTFTAQEQGINGEDEPCVIIESLNRALRESHLSGAVVTGPHGSGRHSSVDTTLSTIKDTVRIIRISGSNFGSNLYLGALSYLLSELDFEADSSRHELLHGLGRLLCPDGQRSVVLMDKPQLVDMQSASILAQLVTMGKIKLLVICEQPQDLPRDIHQLMRLGQLEHIAVKPMSINRLHQYLHHELGASMSIYALAMLRHFTENNCELIMELARIWISQGQLVMKENTWLLKDLSLPNSPALELMFNAKVSGLTNAELNLLYAISLCGPVSLANLVREQLAEPVDRLHSRGHLRISEADGNQILSVLPLDELLVRQNVHPDLTTTFVPLTSLMSQIYTAPEVAQGFQTMKYLNTVGDLVQLIEHAEAFAISGYESQAWRTAPLLRVQILKVHIQTMLRQKHWASALSQIRRAAVELNRYIDAHGINNELMQTLQEMDLLENQANVASRYAESSQWGDEFGPARIKQAGWLSETMRLRAGALQAEIWATSNRHIEAIDMVRSIDHELHALQTAGDEDSSNLDDEILSVQEILLQCELLSGQWNRAAYRLKNLTQQRNTTPRLVAEATMLAGILRGLDDDADGALRVLKPCLQQLKQFDLSGASPTIEAVVAYALVVQLQSPVEREAVLRDLDIEYRSASLGFLDWIRESFISLALAHTDSAVKAQDRLITHANRLEAAGLDLLRLFTLGMAMRMGSSKASTQVLGLIPLSRGQLGDEYANIAHGILQMTELNALQLSELVRAGHRLLTSSKDNAIFAVLSLKEQRLLNKYSSTLIQPLSEDQQSNSHVQEATGVDTDRWYQQLTKRESEIIDLVLQGNTNADVARKTGISIRTVEGHLYQAYGKLQVSNRQELLSINRQHGLLASQL